MERIIMICSNCKSELGYVEVENVKNSDYSKYICGVCNNNLVPDLSSPIEDILEYVEEDTTSDIKETPMGDEIVTS